MTYIVNGKGPAGWRIDKLSDSEDDAQVFGLDFLKSYVAFVRERPVAEQIAKLLNEAESTAAPPPAPQEGLSHGICEKDLREDCGAPDGDVSQCRDGDCPLKKAGLRAPLRGEGPKGCTRSRCKSRCAVLWCPRCGTGLCEKHCGETFAIACPHSPVAPPLPAEPAAPQVLGKVAK